MASGNTPWSATVGSDSELNARTHLSGTSSERSSLTNWPTSMPYFDTDTKKWYKNTGTISVPISTEISASGTPNDTIYDGTVNTLADYIRPGYATAYPYGTVNAANFTDNFGSDNWTKSHANLTISGGAFNWNSKLNAAQVENGYRDLNASLGGNLSDSAWVIRCKVNVANLTQGANANQISFYVGASSVTGIPSTAMDFIGLKITVTSGAKSIIAIDTDGAALSTASADTTFARLAATGSLWVEIKRLSTTKYIISLFTSSTFDVDSWVESAICTVAATTNTLRYAYIGIQEGANTDHVLNGTVDDFQVWNSVTTAYVSPRGFVVPRYTTDSVIAALSTPEYAFDNDTSTSCGISAVTNKHVFDFGKVVGHRLNIITNSADPITITYSYSFDNVTYYDFATDSTQAADVTKTLEGVLYRYIKVSGTANRTQVKEIYGESMRAIDSTPSSTPYTSTSIDNPDLQIHMSTATGMVMHMGFESNVKDTTGNGNDGTVTGTATYTRGANGGQAFKFDGSTYITLPSTRENYFDFGHTPTQQSMAFWIKGSSIPTGTIVAKADSQTDTGWSVYCDGTWVYFRFTNTTTTNELICKVAGTSIFTGAWVHVVFCRDRSAFSGCTLYINGASVALTSVTNNLSASIDNAKNVTIGAESDGGVKLPSGILLDDFMLFSRILSASEVATLYNFLTGKVVALLVNIDRTLTTETVFVISGSADGGATWTDLRYLNVSDFTDDTNRYLPINILNQKISLIRIRGQSTAKVLSINGVYFMVVSTPEIAGSHYHRKLSASTVDNDLDTN